MPTPADDPGAAAPAAASPGAASAPASPGAGAPGAATLTGLRLLAQAVSGRPLEVRPAPLTDPAPT